MHYYTKYICKLLLLVLDMSLFKARDWWNTKVGDNEEFDIGCMVVGNISNIDSIKAIGMLNHSCRQSTQTHLKILLT